MPEPGGAPHRAHPGASGKPCRPEQRAGPVTYRVLRTDEQDAYDEPLPAATRAAEAFDTRALDQAAGSAFGGTSRKAAKILIVDAETEVFTDLSDLMASLPRRESKLKHHHPPIQTGPRSNRVALERRNVRVRAFLYAASREEDNDFHLVVGRDPNETPLLCMTMELSRNAAYEQPAFCNPPGRPGRPSRPSSRRDPMASQGFNV